MISIIIPQEQNVSIKIPKKLIGKNVQVNVTEVEKVSTKRLHSLIKPGKAVSEAEFKNWAIAAENSGTISLHQSKELWLQTKNEILASLK